MKQLIARINLRAALRSKVHLKKRERERERFAGYQVNGERFPVLISHASQAARAKSPPRGTWSAVAWAKSIFKNEEGKGKRWEPRFLSRYGYGAVARCKIHRLETRDTRGAMCFHRSASVPAHA
jgi:hypothetical protein